MSNTNITPNLLEQAASATQGMIPGQVQNRNLTAFGPQQPSQIPPMPRFQVPPPVQPTPGGSYSSIGEGKRARNQAIVKNINSAVRAGKEYIDANKQRALSMDLERLMSAQQGIQEARQILQQDPNNQEAKAALEKDTGIVNMLTKDPKKAKQFQKALNIDLFGNGKNKTENQAFIQAWDDFNKKQQAGAR